MKASRCLEASNEQAAGYVTAGGGWSDRAVSAESVEERDVPVRLGNSSIHDRKKSNSGPYRPRLKSCRSRRVMPSVCLRLIRTHATDTRRADDPDPIASHGCFVSEGIRHPERRSTGHKDNVRSELWYL